MVVSYHTVASHRSYSPMPNGQTIACPLVSNGCLATALAALSRTCIACVNLCRSAWFCPVVFPLYQGAANTWQCTSWLLPVGPLSGEMSEAGHADMTATRSISARRTT